MRQEHRHHCLIGELAHRVTDANMEEGPGAGERLTLKEGLQEEVTLQSSLQRCFAQGQPIDEGE